MRTHLNLDDELIAEAKKAGKHPSTTAAVQAALEHYVRWLKNNRDLLKLRGIGWEGDLDAMRRWQPK